MQNCKVYRKHTEKKKVKLKLYHGELCHNKEELKLNVLNIWAIIYRSIEGCIYNPLAAWKNNTT